VNVSRSTQLLAAFAGAVFAAMWIGVAQGWSWLRQADDSALEVFARFGAEHPWWVALWDVFCLVFSPTVFRILAVGVIIWLLRRRYRRAALFLVLSVEVSGLLTAVVKYVVERPRPETAFVYAYSSSFPSGHALGIMVIAVASLTLLLPMVVARWRGVLITGGVLLVLLIGVGRVVLNVHHPSDVIAGWALGYVWFVFCVWVVPPSTLRTVAAAERSAPDTGC
jgi:membrane-associated phospholipid phosphatase